jgi:apolipoprotein N-acyltransferase
MLFPFMAAQLRSDGADTLVVVTNLGWFGRSGVLAQEKAISRYRAIETRLPLVHCANTGFSGVFDPWGRFTAVGPPHRRIAAALRLPQAAAAPVALTAAPLLHGVAVVLALLLIAVAVLPARRGTPAGRVSGGPAD